MKSIILASFAILLCVAVSFGHSGKHEGSAKFTKHFNETLFAITEKGQVSIEVLLDEKEYKIGSDMIGIVIHDSRDEDVEETKVLVTVSETAEPLKVKEKGGGLYLVPGSGLPKQGRWELRISVKKGQIDDRVTFSFPSAMAKRLPAGKVDAGMLKGQ